jgi:hypothetical protein
MKNELTLQIERNGIHKEARKGDCNLCIQMKRSLLGMSTTQHFHHFLVTELKPSSNYKPEELKFGKKLAFFGIRTRDFSCFKSALLPTEPFRSAFKWLTLARTDKIWKLQYQNFAKILFISFSKISGKLV